LTCVKESEICNLNMEIFFRIDRGDEHIIERQFIVVVATFHELALKVLQDKMNVIIFSIVKQHGYKEISFFILLFRPVLCRLGVTLVDLFARV